MSKVADFDFDKVFFAPGTFTAGMEYQHNNMHDVMTGYNRDLTQEVRIASAFFQNEWKMNAFSLLAGFRLDEHNLIDNLIFSPRVNLLYKPMDKLQARATWSTGFRAPQAYDEDLHITAVGGEGVLISIADGLKPEELTEEKFRSYLWDPSLPDPDLIIRTSGEERLSNFLLFQSAYAEFFFSPVLWPDFGPRELRLALDSYAARTRRFGKTDDQLR